MKKHLALLKEKKEDMDLVISSMGRGLSLSEAIEQILVSAEVKNVVVLLIIYIILFIKKSMNS